MKLLDYLKWRAEFKAQQKEANRKRKEEEEVITLVGEIEGLKQKIRVYEKVNTPLFFSNHPFGAAFYEELCKRQARLAHLQIKKEVK